MALYEKNGKIYTDEYMEIYIPNGYFEDNRFAINKGVFVETLGIVYAKTFGKEESPYKIISVPTTIRCIIHEFSQSSIKIRDRVIDVMVLRYLKNSYVMDSAIPKNAVIAEQFLKAVLMGKLPPTLSYDSLINIWWKNLEIAGFNLNTPSKIMESIIAYIYRDSHNKKKRFGETYGKSADNSPYEYKTGNVRDVVEGLSTFSGMVFEDVGRMITSGLNNSLEGVEEPVSPLEKIIHM